MGEKIHLFRMDKEIEVDEIMKRLNCSETDICFVAGSVIESQVNSLSGGMGNKLSDLDVFVIAENPEEICNIDYNTKLKKTSFMSIQGISLDVEVYSKKEIMDLFFQVKDLDFSNGRLDNVRTQNAIRFRDGFTWDDLISLVHRLFNSIPIFNVDGYMQLKNSISFDNFCKLVCRRYINFVDLRYDDAIGYIDECQYKLAVHVIREMLLNSVSAYLFYKKRTFDRAKWIPLLLENISKIDETSQEVYTGFTKLYYESQLIETKDYLQNVESALDFCNRIIELVGEEDGI